MTWRMGKQEHGHQLEEMLACEITALKDLSCFTCKTEHTV